MVKFIGEYSAKLDDKGRLVFPSGLKAQMKGMEDCRFVVKKDIYAPCLQLFSYPQWEVESEELRASLNFLNPDHATFWRMFTRNRAVVEPDEKTGRILIPRKLLDEIGAQKDLVFCGSDHIIELWSQEQFDAAAVSNDEYIRLAQSLSSRQ